MIRGRSRVFPILVPALALALAGWVPFPGWAGTCDPPVARAVSVQGRVEAQSAGESSWRPVAREDAFCPGDMIRVLGNGRGEIVLENETIVRMDRDTTVTIRGPEKKETSLLDLLRGIVYFFSRTPRSVTVHTPFVNAAVEGTEFLVALEENRARVTVFEGTVAATNPEGSVRVGPGQSAVAEAGKAPGLQAVVRPRDAVQWTLYYPPVLPAPSADPDAVPPPEGPARVASLLSVGRVEEARAEIEGILGKSPGDARALALLSSIDVAQNRKDEALALGRKAVDADPGQAAAWIALSYAQQAAFDLEGARESLREAVRRAPGDALAWARLSELELSFGDLAPALAAAGKAASLDPGVSRTQTVLGYAGLAEGRRKESKAAFEKAISLDQADPLPRLGLGLAQIREGRLEEGRRQIEIAAALDPGNSLLRSYLGKAYYEEKRNLPASAQLETAKSLDPADPTPYLYDAIRKQSVNRPVEALHDLQRSIERNGNRAVYRSRLLLDEDLAAREASLARIYEDLGFQQRALVEGWSSVNTDPANWSAHRFLADSYAALPRHEIARVSELLQSQMLQPINLTPLQPQLARSNLLLQDGAGPANISFNEFNPLFVRDRFTLQADGVAGSHGTFGEDIVPAGLYGNFSLSLGQFHFQTDGFRQNNDLTENLYDLFVQARLSFRTSVQAEIRGAKIRNGDLTLHFDPNDFIPTFRGETDGWSGRVGLHHAFAPGSDLLLSVVYQDQDVETNIAPTPVNSFHVDTGEKGYSGEAQHLFRSGRFRLVSGAGYFQIDRKETTTVVAPLPPPPPPIPPPPPTTLAFTTVSDQTVRQTDLYVYSLIRFPETVTWTLGASVDFLDGFLQDRSQFNPKIGVTWTPWPDTTLRAAAFRVLKRMLITNQTLEPTQVAGFNQFYDDASDSSIWNYGVALDQKVGKDLSGGVDFSWRDLTVPFRQAAPPAAPGSPPTIQILEGDWKERLGRAYLYWAPHDRVAASAEYFYERFEREPGSAFFFEEVETHRVPLGLVYSHPCGFGLTLRETYYAQEGMFLPSAAPPGTPAASGSDRFWLTDAAVSYRLPARFGIVSVEGRNLFDTSYRYEDTDPANPRIQPGRTFFFKVSLVL